MTKSIIGTAPCEQLCAKIWVSQVGAFLGGPPRVEMQSTRSGVKSLRTSARTRLGYLLGQLTKTRSRPKSPTFWPTEVQFFEAWLEAAPRRSGNCLWRPRRAHFSPAFSARGGREKNKTSLSNQKTGNTQGRTCDVIVRKHSFCVPGVVT